MPPTTRALFPVTSKLVAERRTQTAVRSWIGRPVSLSRGYTHATPNSRVTTYIPDTTYDAGKQAWPGWRTDDNGILFYDPKVKIVNMIRAYGGAVWCYPSGVRVTTLSRLYPARLVSQLPT